MIIHQLFSSTLQIQIHYKTYFSPSSRRHRREHGSPRFGSDTALINRIRCKINLSDSNRSKVATSEMAIYKWNIADNRCLIPFRRSNDGDGNASGRGWSGVNVGGQGWKSSLGKFRKKDRGRGILVGETGPGYLCRAGNEKQMRIEITAQVTIVGYDSYRLSDATNISIVYTNQCGGCKCKFLLEEYGSVLFG